MPRQIWLALLGLLLIALPFGLKGYTVYILSIAGANILAAVGLNLLMGYAGQVSIGQAAFLAIGGYTSALLMTKLGLSFWLAFPLAGMLTSLTGLILFIPALRLGTIYLAIATLGFGAAVQQLIPLPYWSAILGGHQGIRVPRPQIGSFVFDTDLELYYLTLVIVVVLLVLSWNVARSYIGRAFIALRDKPAAAEALGINPTRYKAYAFSGQRVLDGDRRGAPSPSCGAYQPWRIWSGKIYRDLRDGHFRGNWLAARFGARRCLSDVLAPLALRGSIALYVPLRRGARLGDYLYALRGVGLLLAFVLSLPSYAKALPQRSLGCSL
jgi:hypothetical protein